MLPDDTRHKIENIISGTIIEGQQDNCVSIRNSLCRRFATSATVKKDFESKSIIKKEQNLWHLMVLKTPVEQWELLS